jgi:hypothetical protein
MLDRCNNPNSTAYPRYGAKGIRVCKRWHLFDNFLEDMGERPAGCTIDRIRSSRNYTPGNCRWATNAVQARNRSHIPMITHDGRTMCIKDWADLLGIRRTTLQERLGRGWPLGKALSSRIDKRGGWKRRL